MRSLRDAFYGQMEGAKKRGIEFELSFDEWLRVWRQSGHLSERGCRKGQYVMARFGDKGPYAIGNVKVCTVEENCSEANLGRKRSVETRKRISAVRVGKPTRTGAVLSEETKEKMRAKALGNQRWLGKTHSDETKLKISETKKKQFAEKRLNENTSKQKTEA